MSFQLMSSQYALANIDEEYARFLEQATFGTTKTSTADIKSNPNYGATGTSPVGRMANWIKDQQDNVAVSSHREYYRKRTNA
jgi:hypothetical protein